MTNPGESRAALPHPGPPDTIWSPHLVGYSVRLPWQTGHAVLHPIWGAWCLMEATRVFGESPPPSIALEPQPPLDENEVAGLKARMARLEAQLRGQQTD